MLESHGEGEVCHTKDTEAEKGQGDRPGARREVRGQGTVRVMKQRYSVLASLLASAESEIERIELAIKNIKADIPADKAADPPVPPQE